MNLSIIQGDCRETLKTLPAESVNCIVTSPPYYGLRDYGTGKWEGGSSDCDHKEQRGGVGESSAKQVTSAGASTTYQFRDTCRKCGAVRVDSQIGLEPTPDAYVAELVAVFREVRRVLRDDGTLWLNLGDSYASGKGTCYNPGGGESSLGKERKGAGAHPLNRGNKSDLTAQGLKPKDLVGIPWRVAFALQADGWYLRQDIIWHKPNPMPESVTDRCTKSHEYMFLLTKSERYWYDSAAVAEPITQSSIDRLSQPNLENQAGSDRVPGKTNGPMKAVGRLREKNNGESAVDTKQRGYGSYCGTPNVTTRNKRSVWTINTQPCRMAHFAVMPEKLVEPCILAGCPPAGRRCDCDEIIATPTGTGEIDDPSMETGRAGMNRTRRTGEGTRPITRREQRWNADQMKQSPHVADMRKICGEAFDHYIRKDRSGARPLPEIIRQDFMGRGWITDAPPCNHPIEPAGTVLDPFGGSGTVAAVAERLGRNSILCELNPEYIEIQGSRTAQTSMALL